jgi:hypothetical protein
VTTAIATEYKGHQFRSRLEARWAVFFDAMGLEWQYEPQGYEFGGERYLPDFFVKKIGWVEVKGSSNVEELLRIVRAASLDGLPLSPDTDRGPRDIQWPDGVTPEQLPNPGIDRILVLGDVPDPHAPWGHVSIGTTFAGTATYRLESFLAAGTRPQSTSERGCVWSYWWKDKPIVSELLVKWFPHGTKVWWLSPGASVAAAYRAARGARFEHGHSGPVVNPLDDPWGPR